MNWILKLLGGEFAGKVGDYFVERQRLKNELKLTKIRAEIDLVKAKTLAEIEQQRHVASWEMAYVQMQTGSYKDEVVLAVVLAPYIGSFVTGVQDYVQVGFQYLDQMPYWAVGLTVAICLAIYGIRHRNANKIQAPGLRDSDVEVNDGGTTTRQS